MKSNKPILLHVFMGLYALSVFLLGLLLGPIKSYVSTPEGAALYWGVCVITVGVTVMISIRAS
jgi:putative Mn2+ efflux pump MntP